MHELAALTRYRRMFFIARNGHEAGPIAHTMITTDHRLRGRTPETDLHSPSRSDQPKPTATTSDSCTSGLAPKLISLTDVMERVALKRTSIYELIKTQDFPLPVKIQRASRWVDFEVSDWIRAQMSKR